MKKEQPKMYIIKKYVMADNALQAIKRDKETPVHDCWVNDEWGQKHLASAIGFMANFPTE